jgi:hypothetical protein
MAFAGAILIHLKAPRKKNEGLTVRSFKIQLSGDPITNYLRRAARQSQNRHGKANHMVTAAPLTELGCALMDRADRESDPLKGA